MIEKLNLLWARALNLLGHDLVPFKAAVVVVVVVVVVAATTILVVVIVPCRPWLSQPT